MSIKALTIINPTSGKGNILEKVDKIKENLQQQGIEADIKFTKKDNNAKDIIEKYQEEKDLILICGGDGTLNEVITAIMNLKEKNKNDEISLFFIPLGTTNDLARTLEIPSKDISISKKVIKSKARKVDIGKWNDKYFCYVAAFGIITDVAYITSQKAKNKYGRLAYYINAFKELIHIPTYKMKITYKNKHLQDEFIYGGITNSESIAGFKWFEKGEIQLEDGKFEGIFIRKPKTILGYFKILSSFLRKEYSENQYITFIQSDKFEIESKENIKWTIDGEFAGEVNQVKILNKKEAIEFAVCSNKL